MSKICVWLVTAALLCPLVGCDGGGELSEGIPKDAIGKTPPPPPGMDVMKEKMAKKGARR
jgi:hypothetical protein